VDGFSKSLALDSSWEEPKKEIKQIVEFIEKVIENVSKKVLLISMFNIYNFLKGKIKETKVKRLQQLAKGIPNDLVSQNRTVVLLNMLSEGVNTGKCIIGKAVNIITTKAYVPM
jgi:hypothetical protein